MSTKVFIDKQTGLSRGFGQLCALCTESRIVSVRCHRLRVIRQPGVGPNGDIEYERFPDWHQAFEGAAQTPEHTVLKCVADSPSVFLKDLLVERMARMCRVVRVCMQNANMCG